MKRFQHGEPLLPAAAKDQGQEERLSSDGGCRTGAGGKALL